jgi:hypothetical protein
MENAPVEVEVWRPVPGYERYDVSSLGRIRSWAVCGPRSAGRRAKTPKILDPFPYGFERKYLGVGITREGEKGVLELVHRLVLMAFDGMPLPDQEAAHRNGVPTDNRLSNLMWATHRENEGHKVAHGTFRVPPPMRGEAHAYAKVTEQDVREIRAQYPAQSYSKIASKYGVNLATIAMIVKRKTWSHVA